MKTWTISKWSLTYAVGGLLLAGGCVRESVSSAPAIVTNEAPAAFSDDNAAPMVDNPPPQAASQDLENAPAKVVSTPAEVAPAASLSASAAEVARLAQSGVDESVMLAFVNNSATTFNIGSDQIIYLNDIGVPGNVVTAMIQRDQILKNTGPASTAPAPVYSSQPVPAQVAPEETMAPPPPVTVAQDAPPPEANVTYTYFRDSLSPYGSWVDVEGYGQCWQPSVVVVDRGWTPYCDRGHWVYSDCGWYWSSDYSWGWAPFHYGRWFRHNRIGWCWAPDTVWGPSWVSWRYNSGYCGWAPLPPTACYRPGVGFTYYGRSVGVSFGFGLNVDHFTFVAADRFCDPHPYRYRLPRQQVTQVFASTTIINPVQERGNPRFHRGIPSKHIAEVSHTDLKPVKIRETPSAPNRGRGEDHDANRGTLTVFRPPLPEPPARISGNRIGEGVKPATPDTVIRRFDPGATMHKGIPGKTSSPNPVNAKPADLRDRPVPIFKTPVAPISQPRNPREPEKTTSPEIKKEIPSATPLLRGPAAPATPTPKAPPAQNILVPKRQPIQSAPPQTFTPAPVRNQPTRPDEPGVRDGSQRGQPRQEKVFIAPTVPAAPVQIRPTPRVPTYQPPVQAPPPQVTPPEPRSAFSPGPVRSLPARIPEASAPPAPRVVAPQVVVPRSEAPRIESRPAPAPAPAPAAQRPASNGDGGKRQDGGNPRSNNR